jgi:hypothetical protein
MTSLGVNSLTSATATLPSPDVPDEEGLVSNCQQMTTSDVRQQDPISYERQLGDSELAYYLPGRATGVNDMFVCIPHLWRVKLAHLFHDRYLHLGFKAPKSRMLRRRVRAVWAILRMRHPLLVSKVVMRSYEDVRFVYVLPSRVWEFRRSDDVPSFVV